MVPANPVYLVEKLSVDRAQKVIPTPEDMAKMLLAAGPDRPLLLVLFHTMARIDEILRLKWEDVNFQEKAVRLWTRKRRGGNWEFDWLPMNEDLEVVLWGLWNKREQDEWVFFNRLQGTRYLYRPKLRLEDCVRHESRSFLDRVFGGEPAAMLIQLVKQTNLAPDEIAELRRILKEKEQ